METARTVQTAFRFTPELVSRLKLRARREHKSVNAFVEQLIEKELGREEDRYEALYRELARIKLSGKVPPEFMSMPRFNVEFTDEELETDPRLAYLVEKHLYR